MVYDTYLDIDLDALVANARSLQEKVKPAKIQAVIKADAYGHVAKVIMPILKKEGIEDFAVANLLEALELRSVDEICNIMVLGKINKNNIAKAIKNNIVMTINSIETADDLLVFLDKNPDKSCNIHIKINSGFNRLGFDGSKEEIQKIVELGERKQIDIKGIFTHLALTSESDDLIQYEKFEYIVKLIESKGVCLGVKHMADSIGAVDYPWARLDMVRVGAALFGLKSQRDSYRDLGLQGTMKMYATINQIRWIEHNEGVGYDYLFKAQGDVKIATVSVGYADGFPRSLSNKGFVSVKGQKCKIVGLICMDQMMIDVTNVQDLEVGENIMLFEIDSNSVVSLDEMAKIGNTNKNDIIVGISKRVPRKYFYEGKSFEFNQLI